MGVAAEALDEHMDQFKGRSFRLVVAGLRTPLRMTPVPDRAREPDRRTWVPLRVVIADFLRRPRAESGPAEAASKTGAEHYSADGGCTPNAVGRPHLQGVMPTPRGVAMIRACRCRTTCAAAQRAAWQPRAVG
jgi:hypothetical protein